MSWLELMKVCKQADVCCHHRDGTSSLIGISCFPWGSPSRSHLHDIEIAGFKVLNALTCILCKRTHLKCFFSATRFAAATGSLIIWFSQSPARTHKVGNMTSEISVPRGAVSPYRCHSKWREAFYIKRVTVCSFTSTDYMNCLYARSLGFNFTLSSNQKACDSPSS